MIVLKRKIEWIHYPTLYCKASYTLFVDYKSYSYMTSIIPLLKVSNIIIDEYSTEILAFNTPSTDNLESKEPIYERYSIQDLDKDLCFEGEREHKNYGTCLTIINRFFNKNVSLANIKLALINNSHKEEAEIYYRKKFGNPRYQVSEEENRRYTTFVAIAVEDLEKVINHFFSAEFLAFSNTVYHDFEFNKNYDDFIEKFIEPLNLQANIINFQEKWQFRKESRRDQM